MAYRRNSGKKKPAFGGSKRHHRPRQCTTPLSTRTLTAQFLFVSTQTHPLDNKSSRPISTPQGQRTEDKFLSFRFLSFIFLNLFLHTTPLITTPSHLHPTFQTSTLQFRDTRDSTQVYITFPPLTHKSFFYRPNTNTGLTFSTPRPSNVNPKPFRLRPNS